MLRYLLALMLLTTPCFAQGLGNMDSFSGSGTPQGSFQGYGNSMSRYGDFSQKYGNNPDVYVPRVDDYLKQDPRGFNRYNNPMPGQGNNYRMRSYNKFNQFNFSLPSY